MLKIVATVNNRQTLILGLDRTNTSRLHLDRPILVDVEALSTELPEGAGPVQDVVLCAGETIADIHAELSAYLPLPPVEEGDDDE